MFCTKCGVSMDDKCVYCSQCGTATANAPQPAYAEPRKLMRSIYDKKIAGVCGGFARYLDVDVTVVRLVWLILTFVPPLPGLIAYIVAWIVMPQEPQRIEAATTTVYQG